MLPRGTRIPGLKSRVPCLGWIVFRERLESSRATWCIQCKGGKSCCRRRQGWDGTWGSNCRPREGAQELRAQQKHQTDLDVEATACKEYFNSRDDVAKDSQFEIKIATSEKEDLQANVGTRNNTFSIVFLSCFLFCKIYAKSTDRGTNHKLLRHLQKTYKPETNIYIYICIYLKMQCFCFLHTCDTRICFSFISLVALHTQFKQAVRLSIRMVFLVFPDWIRSDYIRRGQAITLH